MAQVFSFSKHSVVSSDIQSKTEAIKRTWLNYVKRGIILGQVRNSILESWKRSQQYDVDPNLLEAPVVLSQEQMNVKIKSMEDVLSLIRPFMYDLYEIVKGTDSVLSFSDSSGTVIELFGDSQIAMSAASVNFRVGVDMSEETVGTNAIGTSLKLGVPMQLLGAEHYSQLWHQANCSSAPIKDPFTNQIIGVITIVGFYWSVHPHSLALVTTAANTINRLILQKGMEKEKLLINNYFAAAMDSVSDGMMVVNRYGEIVRMNGIASHLLKISFHEDYRYILKNIEYLEPLKQTVLETIAGNEIISQKEIQIPYENKSQILFTSRRIIFDQDCFGAIVILKKSPISETKRITAKYFFSSLIGENKEFVQMVQLAGKAAKTDKSILVLGESGTGKELIAQAIHNASARAHERFVAINCAAMPKELIASELFGYAEGAFTGAVKGGRKGRFEEANGGTIFLDEIGDMPLELQAHLLRVLEEREVTPVGSNRSKPIDIRIIAATHQNLFDLVKKGLFRLDLFYRLNVITLEIPPLRHRIQDLDLFFEKFLPEKILSASARQCLYHYDWPGNLRELRNVLEQIEIFCEDKEIALDHLPNHIRNQTEKYMDQVPIYKTLTKEAEKDSIIRTLKTCSSVTEAAEKLEVSISTMYRWINKYDINPKEIINSN